VNEELFSVRKSEKNMLFAHRV